MLILFFFTGACIGSFINLVIYRLPIIIKSEVSHDDKAHLPAFNLLVPRSHCPECQKTLSIWQLIPLVSWLLQRGRCHSCHQAISASYPLIELMVASIFMAASYCWHDPVTALALSLFVSALLTLAVIDVKHLLLPDVITLPLIWCGLLWNSSAYSFVSLDSAVFGATVGYLSLWSIYWLFRLLRNKEGLGYGDFKLMSALGAWMGVGSINTILLLGSLIGCIGWFVYRHQHRGGVMPFGPALIAAACLWLFSQSPLISEVILSSCHWVQTR